MECEPAVLLMPIADVLLHPEFKHFGVKTSIALLKLITPVQSSKLYLYYLGMDKKYTSYFYFNFNKVRKNLNVRNFF